jgi:alkanesulfonate monooxygenase SsuD/methylene tetrahydromethanopterin reductase-like flavin-dependent oxidoreductase (luciferase family)
MNDPTRRPLKVGVVLVQLVETPRGDDVPGWPELRQIATTAEAVGFDSVWIPDHLRSPLSDAPTDGAWESWSLLAALAAVTTRVQLGTWVLAVPFRNPALTAKMADTVDEISGGRLILGLGAGYHKPEFDAFGFPFDHLASRFEEGLQIIRGLLRDGHVDFEGTYYQARDCELRPRGAQRAPGPQGPPILIGTIGERMLRLTARHADLWNASHIHTGNRPAGVAPLQAKVDAACREVGRDPATLERTAGVLVETAPHPPSVFEEPPLAGTPEELAEGLRAYARAGIGHVQLFLEPRTAAAVEAFAPVLEILDRGP